MTSSISSSRGGGIRPMNPLLDARGVRDMCFCENRYGATRDLRIPINNFRF